MSLKFNLSMENKIRKFEENNLSFRPKGEISASSASGMKILRELFYLLCLMAFNTNVFAQNQNITETFETATKKGRYPEGNVTTANGVWVFSDALVYDKEPQDFRPMAPRLLSAPALDDEPGSVSSTFDVKGLKSVKVGFIGFKPDPGYFQIEVFVSADRGQNWRSIGVSRGRYDKSQETYATFKTNAKKEEELRVKIVNASAPRLNRLNRINITLIEMGVQ